MSFPPRILTSLFPTPLLLCLLSPFFFLALFQYQEKSPFRIDSRKYFVFFLSMVKTTSPLSSPLLLFASVKVFSFPLRGERCTKSVSGLSPVRIDMLAFAYPGTFPPLFFFAVQYRPFEGKASGLFSLRGPLSLLLSSFFSSDCEVMFLVLTFGRRGPPSSKFFLGLFKGALKEKITRPIFSMAPFSSHPSQFSFSIAHKVPLPVPFRRVRVRPDPFSSDGTGDSTPPSSPVRTFFLIFYLFLVGGGTPPRLR